VRTGTPFNYVDSTNTLNAPYQQGIVRYTPAPGGGPVKYHVAGATSQLAPNDFLLANLPAGQAFGNPAYGPSPNRSSQLTDPQAAAIGISDFGP